MNTLHDVIAFLEERVKALEAHLGIAPPAAPAPEPEPTPEPVPEAPAPDAPAASE